LRRAVERAGTGEGFRFERDLGQADIDFDVAGAIVDVEVDPLFVIDDRDPR
jgi:hypothetical protein